MNKTISPKSVAVTFGVLIVTFLAAFYAIAAWTEPSSSPPGDNVPAPINVSTASQTMTGTLAVPELYLNATGVEGNIYMANKIQGYDDLFLMSDAGDNATIYLSPAAEAQRMSFYVAGTEKWRIDSTGSLTIGSVPWGRLTSFPSACSSGQYVSAVGSVLTCSAPAGGVGGSGTANYVSKFTAGTTLGNSQIFDNGTNVGIGTTGPGEKLAVESASGGRGIIDVNQVGTDNWSGLKIDRDGAEKWFIGVSNVNDSLRLRRNGASDDLVIDSSGNLTVGEVKGTKFVDKDDTSYYIDPSGNTNLSGNLTVGGKITATFRTSDPVSGGDGVIAYLTIPNYEYPVYGYCQFWDDTNCGTDYRGKMGLNTWQNARWQDNNGRWGTLGGGEYCQCIKGGGSLQSYEYECTARKALMNCIEIRVWTMKAPE